MSDARSPRPPAPDDREPPGDGLVPLLVVIVIVLALWQSMVRQPEVHDPPRFGVPVTAPPKP